MYILVSSFSADTILIWELYFQIHFRVILWFTITEYSTNNILINKYTISMPSLITTADNAVAALIGVQDLSVYKEHTVD